MATAPSQTFHVTVVARIDNAAPKTLERHVPIPPDYSARDLRQFFGLIVQDTARDLNRQQNWGRPVLRALLINHARMRRIEELVAGHPSTLAEQIRDVIMADDDDALSQWGEDDIEG